MGRIVAIDYGKKRTGLAATDPLKIIASPLETIATSKIWGYLRDYNQREDIETFVVGYPKDLYDRDTHMTKEVEDFASRLKKKFPGKEVHLQDEAFTSKMAVEAMVAGGMKKKERRKKENIDKISAAIILQFYLTSLKI